MRPAPSPAVVLVVVLWLAVVAPAGLGRAAAEDAAPPPTAPVARLAVTSLADGSSSSLRHVLLQANSYAGLAHADAPVLVTLNVSGIVRLQSSLPPIAVPIHIRQGLADPATAAAAFGSSFTFVVDGSLVPSPPPSAPVLRGLDLLPSANGAPRALFPASPQSSSPPPPQPPPTASFPLPLASLYPQPQPSLPTQGRSSRTLL